MNKKILFPLLGLPLLLTACGSITSETGAIKLKVWGPNQEQNFLQAKAEEFKTANPNLNIDFEFAAIGEPDLSGLLTIDVAGGADVFAFPDDQLQDVVTAGALSPVQQFRADVIARNIDWSVDVATVGDTVYAYPNTADNGVFMYYDKRHISAGQMTSLDSILAIAEEKNSKIVIDPAGGWVMSMWFATTGNISWDAAKQEQTIDWNNPAGLNAAKGMFKAYSTNRIIRSEKALASLFLQNETDITQGVIAGVSGTWNAGIFTNILGSENIGMIKMPTFTVGSGEQVQLGSMIGAKLIGVNGFTKQPALAHQFANFLTNANTQKDRAIQLGVGPSNLVAASDSLVKVIPSVIAFSDQVPYGILQAKSVSSFYWSPAGAFADAVISEATAIDALVEVNLTEAIDTNVVANEATAIANFRVAEKARLINLRYETLQDKLDAFVQGVLAVNEE